MEYKKVTDIFGRASKKNLRFKMKNNWITVTDLWTLDLNDLDKMAVALDGEVGGTKSFLTEKTKTESDNNLRFDIVKAVIGDKIAQKEANEARAATIEKKELIKSELQNRKNEKITNLSEAELEKELEKLNT